LMAAFFVGGGLGLSGLLLQNLLKNPLAEPYTLGISGGASLGASIAIFLGLQPFWFFVPAASALGCLAISFVLLRMYTKMKSWDPRIFILSGIMLTLFSNALILFLMSIFSPEQLSKSILWLTGHFGSERDNWWPVLAITLALAAAWTLKNAQRLNAFYTNEEIAKSIVGSTKRLRFTVLTFCFLLTTMAVTISGLIAFAGLIAPHVSYQIAKSIHIKKLAWLSICVGGNLVLLSDTIVRVLSTSTEVPTGSLVALIGAPVFIFLLVKGKNRVAA
jgi:iron complex transport system permease protein